MVPVINLVVMIICVLICIAVMAVPYLMINKRSSALETGLPGAIGYGILGYAWQYVLYMYGNLGINILVLKFGMPTLIGSLLDTILTTGCMALALYWGIYLTNQKQISIYRSATVGIGYSLGMIGLNYIYMYGRCIYFGIQINSGSFQGEQAFKDSIINTSIGTCFMDAYKQILMFVIVFAIALIMGKYYIAKDRKKTWISVLVIYESIMLLSAIVKMIFAKSDLAFNIVAILVLTVAAVAGGIVLWNWFKTNEVEVNPLVIIKNKKK